MPWISARKSKARRARTPLGTKRTVTRGLLSFTGHAGRNTVSLQGNIPGAHRLPLGNYALLVTATNVAGQRSSTERLRFTIVGSGHA